jgi:hypothetical protein
MAKEWLEAGKEWSKWLVGSGSLPSSRSGAMLGGAAAVVAVLGLGLFIVSGSSGTPTRAAAPSAVGAVPSATAGPTPTTAATGPAQRVVAAPNSTQSSTPTTTTASTSAKGSTSTKAHASSKGSRRTKVHASTRPAHLHTRRRIGSATHGLKTHRSRPA